MNDKNLKAKVTCYSRNKAIALNDVLKYYRTSENLEHAIERAGKFWVRDHTISSHQRCISKIAIASFQDVLPSAITKSIDSFDALYNEIEQLNIKGIGKLTNYDTALRLGAYLKLYPKRVYLQRGASTGFTNLLERKAPRIADVKEFPPALCRLEPHHIENSWFIRLKRTWPDGPP